MYSDDNEAALGRVLSVVRRYTTMPIGLQLSHAGRKASSRPPSAYGPVDTGEWQTVGPSAVPFSADRQVPAALDRAGMDRVIEAFAQAARRAALLGLDKGRKFRITPFAAFARAMVLPRTLLGGRSSIRYVRSEDLDRPKSQRYQIFVDEPISLPS